MKSLFITLLFIAPSVFAAPRGTEIQTKVVELHITRMEEKTPVKGSKSRIMKLPGHGVCTGFFIDGLGDILTAGHCTEQAATIEIETSDGKTYAASIVAVSSRHDIALLHIDAVNTPYFIAASSASQGEDVFVFGSPLGITRTLSKGILAKRNGDIDFLDCSVLPGNSGSPVLNERGEVIGVATAVAIVGLGVTHLAIMESLDALRFFVAETFGRNR